MPSKQNTLESENFNVSADLVQLAQRLADESGKVIAQYFRADFHMEDKQDQSPVTIADKEAEKAIRAILKQERPDDGIHGEEFGSAEGSSGYLWVLDPIDGTKSFVTGRPIFATLIGLVYNGEAVLGVINQPIIGDRWIGVKGQGTTHNGQPVRVRECPDITKTRISTTGPEFFELEDYLRLYRFLKQEGLFSQYGGDSYSYGCLASGWLDAALEGHMKLHDYAALIPIIEEAGGIITDWQGKPLPLNPTFDNRQVIASGDEALHRRLCGVLAQ
jgi:inositol-phosphate phosphatase / L-galactose 1-phosphate phosphatase / histidinol-phosphatase